MKLDNASFFVRLIRRLGRFAIAIASLTAFWAVGGAVYVFIGSPKLTVYCAFGAAIAVYTIFDRLDLIPEDPDKIITLSLTERAAVSDSDHRR